MTTKQKLVATKLVENGGNIGKAMIAAGYSPATAKTPQKLTESKGWKHYTSNNYPNDEITVQALRRLFEAVRIKRFNFPLHTSDTDIKEIFHRQKDFKLLQIIIRKTKKVAFYAAPDNMVQLKALDIIYKLKGYYSN